MKLQLGSIPKHLISVQGMVIRMLMPKKVRHRKQQRGRSRGMSKGHNWVNFGEYGLQALEPGWITSRQIEAARIAMTRHIKRGGKVWINVFPDKPVTEKELISFCKETLANFKVPKKVEFCDLPKTSTGKIQKFELRKKAKEIN